MEKHTNYNLDLAIIMQHTLAKDTTWSKKIMEVINKPVSTRISFNNILNPKATVFLKALQYVGITSNVEGRVKYENDSNNTIIH